jgi:hypothetical protein
VAMCPKSQGLLIPRKLIFVRFKAISPATSTFTQAKSGYIYADQQFRF